MAGYKARALVQAIVGTYFTYSIASDPVWLRVLDIVSALGSLAIIYYFCTTVRKQEKAYKVFKESAEEYFTEPVMEVHNRQDRRHPEGLHNQRFLRRNARLAHAKGYSYKH